MWICNSGASEVTTPLIFVVGLYCRHYSFKAIFAGNTLMVIKMIFFTNEPLFF